MREKKQRLTSWITLGVKILIGATLISNLFIGLLLYTNEKSNTVVATQVEEVLDVKNRLSENLRETIVSLQKSYLQLPELLKVDAKDTILQTLSAQYGIVSEKVLRGRTSYLKKYKRKQRRDLAKGKLLVDIREEKLVISMGIFDSQGGFTDSVKQIVIKSSNPEVDLDSITELIKNIQLASEGVEAYENKILQLSALIADAGIEAEKTRNEILERVESIAEMEDGLKELTSLYQRRTRLTAGIALCANMIFLFLLIRLVVEKPLKRLTYCIDRIRNGQPAEVPFMKRVDQIGVLADAVQQFKHVLIDVQNDNKRKEEERSVLDDMFNHMNTVIHGLDNRTHELLLRAESVEELAVATEGQSQNAAGKAVETSRNTSDVTELTKKLQDAFNAISTHVQNQAESVTKIMEGNDRSRTDLENLNSSIEDIKQIVSMVREITDQTKLLALNATIEAARAGAAGKGFAVVASEVKDLSHKTELATKDIVKKVSSIEGVGKKLIDNMKSIDTKMKDMSQITRVVTDAVRLQQHETDSIAALAGQSFENIQNVSVSMVEVQHAATKTRNHAGEVYDYSTEIASELDNLLKGTTGRLQRLAN